MLNASLFAAETGTRIKTLYVNLSAAGNYIPGGDILDLTRIANPLFLPGNNVARNPVAVSELNEEMSGFYVGVIPGSAPNAWKMKFYNPGGVELPAGPYPMQVTGGVLQLAVILQSGVN